MNNEGFLIKLRDTIVNSPTFSKLACTDNSFSGDLSYILDELYLNINIDEVDDRYKHLVRYLVVSNGERLNFNRVIGTLVKLDYFVNEFMYIYWWVLCISTGIQIFTSLLSNNPDKQFWPEVYRLGNELLFTNVAIFVNKYVSTYIYYLIVSYLLDLLSYNYLLSIVSVRGAVIGFIMTHYVIYLLAKSTTALYRATGYHLKLYWTIFSDMYLYHNRLKLVVYFARIRKIISNIFNTINDSAEKTGDYNTDIVDVANTTKYE